MKPLHSCLDGFISRPAQSGFSIGLARIPRFPMGEVALPLTLDKDINRVLALRGQGETDEWWPETLLHTRLRVMFRALGSRKTGKTCRILRVPSQVIGKSCPRSCPQYSDYDRLAADGLIRHILTPGPRSLFLFLSNVNCYVPPLLLPAGPLRSWQFSFS